MTLVCCCPWLSFSTLVIFFTYFNIFTKKIFFFQLTVHILSKHSCVNYAPSCIVQMLSLSLSRQSTVDSDSGSTISTGEPIRKSPREVIIPIAVEGGGFVTPSSDTLTRMRYATCTFLGLKTELFLNNLNFFSSVNDSEDESTKGSRCFTLRSTKRRQPEQNQAAQPDTADSLSSDEDDNFQLLTAENLFSTLLSRVSVVSLFWWRLKKLGKFE